MALFAQYRPGALELTITPDRGSTLNISNSDVKGCKVCTGSARSRQCNASLLLKENTPVSVEFDCSKPQDVFNVEIVKNIAFKIDFSNAGLRQINASDSCADRHSYTLRAFQATGDVAVGKYCKTGPISSAQILNRGSFSLDVPAGQKLQNGRFDVSVGEEIKSLAKITLTLPKGTSSAELLSPNYPDSFPDDDVMEWYFEIPDKHKTSVQFLQHRQPKCLKKDTAVEYHNRGRGALVLRLTDPQPEHNSGNFSLTLRNCEMDRRRAGSAGLSLNFKVVSSSISSPVLCKVDVSKMDGLALHIEKLRPASDCEMKINSVLTETITVTSNSDLSFQDCLPEDVRVTAARVIGCNQLKECPKTVNLSVPVRLPTCLPAPLSSVTWTLRPPEHSTVELISPSMYLKQCVPWLPCNDSVIIKLVEDDRSTVGHFCPQGAIQKVQIRTHNVSVTVSSTGDEALIYKNVLIAKMKEEISERYIFTVVPKRDTPVFLASPGWPVGMESYSTASWIISVPPKMDARLVFTNISQPKCSNRHTSIKIQRVGHLEEDYSRREDEEAESEITVSESFYFNMSNCRSERGRFSAVTKITLQKSKNLLLTIILSVVAALLVIFVIVLVVVCVVIRKKKKQLNHQVSIYNPNGTVFLPGQNGLPETRDDHSDHEYASIEDTLVYTHLLKKGREVGMYGEFDTYRPFTGHTDSTKPLFSKGQRCQRNAAVAEVITGGASTSRQAFEPWQTPGR
ncbi:CUB domain-containing protein 1 [Collichthys lucidus]|uniref:CUB domain-containing protein 1 n=1 Tax=Collichthys lucidus TaxID=240159 RepID=A0A4U5V5U6_COLLU|nr:CUB domain-containing protein 1 [Collichthys lucidus]